jgi:hypothetical protein
MRIRHSRIGLAVALLFVRVATASGQATAPPIQGTTTTAPTLSLANTLTALVKPVGTEHVGDALALATQLGIGTTPFGASSGGFLIVLDPNTGLQVRTATTFGPSFAERALTNGEGKVSIGANFASATLNRLGDLDVEDLQVLNATAATPAASRSGTTNLRLTSKTVVISGRLGVTDKFDVGVFVPLVTVEVKGTSTLRNGSGQTLLFAQGNAKSNGLGDIAGIAKYRFYSFGSGLPDPGGMAVMVTMRLPTGDKDNLRGLGVTRTFASYIISAGKARFRPHANVGYGFWSKGVTVASDYATNGSVEARHQFEYAGGVELEAAPKLTLLLDLLGGSVLDGGKVDFATIPNALASPAATSTQALVALPESIRKIALAPGLKVNLKGKMLLSLNALVALSDSGLHSRVIPVAGIDLTF